MCQILIQDSEDIVRTEAALAVAIIYQENGNCSGTTTMISNCMKYVATEEKSPTVRKAALSFWNNIIDILLSEQGMTDNNFPEAVFSKELKKIIILDDLEIKKRLVKVLFQLSENVCLQVLETDVKSEDAGLQETVQRVLKKITDLLENYKVSISDLENYKPCAINNRKKEVERGRTVSNISEKKANVTPREFLEFVNDFMYPCHNSVTHKTDNIETILSQLMDSTVLTT